LLALPGDDLEAGIDHVDDNHNMDRIGRRTAWIDFAKVNDIAPLIVIQQGESSCFRPPT